MKTRLECEKVLGKDLYNKVEEYLENKDLSKETIDRVLDYLTLNKVAFPYVNINVLTERLCSNLEYSIQHNEMKQALRELFKYRYYGYANGEKIVLNDKPIKFILPKKMFNTMLDALIHHEFDHIATTFYKKFKKEEYRELLLSINFFNEDNLENTDDIKRKIDCFIDDWFDENIPERYRRNYKQEFYVGINSQIFRCFKGIIAFNEGITAYKMKQLDKVAGQGGVMCQSGYVLEEEIAEHFAKVIGEEKLISWQIQGDLLSILNEYKQKTGKSGKEIIKMFEPLESRKYKSAFHKLSAQIRYGLTKTMDKNTKELFKNIVGDKAKNERE